MVIDTSVESDAMNPVQGETACLFLLFSPSARPTADGIKHAIAESRRLLISHDPADVPGAEGERATWLELLLDGLTFDVLGLAPGPGLDWGTARHHIGITPQAITACEAIAIAPGPHLAGAGNTLPVVRGLVETGAILLSALEDAPAVLWKPAGSATGRPMFLALAQGWLGGGVFPGLGLAGFTLADDGTLISDGLAFFIGRELEIAASLADDKTAATQLAIRLIDFLVTQGSVSIVGNIPGPDGAPLRLVFSSDERRIRVEKG